MKERREEKEKGKKKERKEGKKEKEEKEKIGHDSFKAVIIFSEVIGKHQL